jgi:hypothetical protein
MSATSLAESNSGETVVLLPLLAVVLEELVWPRTAGAVEGGAEEGGAVFRPVLAGLLEGVEAPRPCTCWIP